MTLITTNTSSNAASSSFTSSIDSTYKLYIFKFYDVNPATDNGNFGFQVNVVDASGYNETITSTLFNADHAEDDATGALQYVAAQDQAQGSAFQTIIMEVESAADGSGAGELFLFSPSNTTYVKHFYSRAMHMISASSGYGKVGARDDYVAGHFNVTGAIDDIQFKFNNGNMDGVIKMYGVG